MSFSQRARMSIRPGSCKSMTVEKKPSTVANHMLNAQYITLFPELAAQYGALSEIENAHRERFAAAKPLSGSDEVALMGGKFTTNCFWPGSRRISSAG